MRTYYLSLAAKANHEAARHFLHASLNIGTFGIFSIVAAAAFCYELYFITIFCGVFASIMMFTGVYHAIEASVEEETARTYEVLGGLYGRGF